MAIENLITDHLDLWTAAVRPKSSAGRGNNSKLELTGIKKLRGLILELAVRGKLVPQDPSDEPASVLLSRIATEKAQLVKEGKIKSEKQYPVISDAELPHSKPDGWVFERLGNVLINRDFERIPLAVSDREKRKGTYDYYGASGVIDHIDDYLFDKPLLLIGEDGANLINRSTPIAFIARGKYWVNNHAHVLDGMNEDLLKYVCLHINAISLVPYITGTAQPKMNQAKMNAIVLGIPPLAEQKKIIAKVDELMTLCDQLELRSESQLAAHQALVETLLATLTDSSDADELAQNWARLSTHFDTLFTTEASIDALKQTILQLAVMGKLVPQDPNDEPASSLLERIAATKAQLVKEKKIKKEKPLPAISEGEKPFELPQGWEWTRLGNIGICSTGKTPSTGKATFYDGEIPFVGPGQITQYGKLLEAEKYLSVVGLALSSEAITGDILMVCIGGSIGKAAICDRRIGFNQQINSIRPVLCDSYFLLAAMTTKAFRNILLERATGSATPIINRSKWEEIPIPMSPYQEQLRIITRVNELMAICDQLKARLQISQQTQLTLAESLVEGALA